MSDDELLPIPIVPAALREAAQLGTLIPFVGAGVSRLAGCPSWEQLAQGAFGAFIDKGQFNHAQLEQLRDVGPRVKLSLAVSLRDEFKVAIDFAKLLHPVDKRAHEKGRRVYGLLSRLGKTFVTTNYDEWLDDDLVEAPLSLSETTNPSKELATVARNVYYKPDELTADNLNRPNSVLHLHGSLRDPERMVITTRDYVRHYANDRRSTTDETENPVLTFLNDLFGTKTVLFIGYGLRELEILEYVILKTRDFVSPGVQPRHFLIDGFFSHEHELMVSMKRYYRDCGIHLLPFLKDQKDFDQLIDVLEFYAAAIPASTLSVLQELEDMKGLLNG